MKNRKFSLKIAALLLACGSFGFVSSFLKPDLVYAMVNKIIEIDKQSVVCPFKNFKFLAREGLFDDARKTQKYEFVQRIFRQCNIGDVLNNIYFILENIDKYVELIKLESVEDGDKIVNEVENKAKEEEKNLKISGLYVDLKSLCDIVCDCVDLIKNEHKKFLEEKAEYEQKGTDFKKVHFAFRVAMHENLQMLRDALNKSTYPSLSQLYTDEHDVTLFKGLFKKMFGEEWFVKLKDSYSVMDAVLKNEVAIEIPKYGRCVNRYIKKFEN